MLRDAVEDAGGLYIGLWNGSELGGSSPVLKEMHELMSSGHSCGIYLDLKVSSSIIWDPPTIWGQFFLGGIF